MSSFQNQVTNIRKYPAVAEALAKGEDIQLRTYNTMHHEWSEWNTGNYFTMDGSPDRTEYRLVPYQPPKEYWLNVRVNKGAPHQIHAYAHPTREEAESFITRCSPDVYFFVVKARLIIGDNS